MRYGYNKFLMEKLAKLALLIALLLSVINCAIFDKPVSRTPEVVINNGLPIGFAVKDFPKSLNNKINQPLSPNMVCKEEYSIWSL